MNGRRWELYEIIEAVQNAKNRKDKIDLLQKHNNPSLEDYLRCLFDDRVQFLLPPGKPPYEPSEEQSVASSWSRENKKLTYFVKGLRADKLIPLKRESIFIGVLESVHPKDAELLVDMINKKAPKTITLKLVKEAFPHLI
jgi:hypothetical protein